MLSAMNASRRPLRVEVVGPLAADEVWRRYTTPELWSGWAPQIRDVDHATDRIGPGTTGVVHGPIGIRVPFVIEVLDDPAMRWAWTCGWGRVRVRMGHGVDPDRLGARAWVEVAGPPLLARAYAPIARRALGRLVTV